MDSLKSTKGKGSALIPIMAIRFHAGEESVEDVLKTSDSLSSSPQQNDDSNWRKDFLQGSFFGRKRSGSIEGTSGIINTNIIGNTGNDNTVGTWKKIKGKVSQAMEDIKSSKTEQIIKCDDSSDVESVTLNSSISDDISETTIDKNKIKIQINNKNRKNSDTDSDIDIDDILDNYEQQQDTIISIPGTASSSSMLKKSLTSLRSKNQKENVKKKTTTITSTSINTSTFLRRRKKEQPILTTNNNLIKKDIEIESGVEMLEDMVLNNSTIINNDNLNIKQQQLIIDENNKEINEKLINDNNLLINNNDNNKNYIDSNDKENINKNYDTNKNSMNYNKMIKKLNKILLKLFYQLHTIIFSLIILYLLYLFKIPDFMKGVIFCLFTITFINNIYTILLTHINKYMFNNNNNKVEKNLFQLPNYNDMPILEIPPIEEHKGFKSYSGWMNEINNYDPGNFHVTMTRSVFIKLDGTILRISNTNLRIPKKSIWNEKEIQKKNINYTKHRVYNILGCKIEMCPKGLARKRHFSRKYPIQLTITNNSEIIQDNSNINLTKELNDSQDNLINLTKDTNDLTNQQTTNIINHQNSSDSNEDKSDKVKFDTINGDIDFAATIMNSDVSILQKIQENQETTTTSTTTTSSINKITAPCSDEIRILLFARNDREKEDWYRRFNLASKGTINEQDILLNDFVTISDDILLTTIQNGTGIIKTNINNDKDDNLNINQMDINDDKNLSTTANVSLSSLNLSVPVTTLSSSIGLTTTTTTTTTTTITPTTTTTSLTGLTSTIQLGSTTNIYNSINNDHDKPQQQQQLNNDKDIKKYDDETLFEGLLMTTSASRGPSDYVKFMSRYQQVCIGSSSPVNIKASADLHKKNRREKKHEDELWKGIDQNLYLGPSGSVVWANVLIGRILYSCLNDSILLEKIQEYLQKKLGAIKLPSFMEDVNVAEIYLGEQPPLIHRVSQPILDERGTWIDADLTYEGLMHMTITTKLNLLRLKKQANHQTNINNVNNVNCEHPSGGSNAIYDSNAESTGASSSESESPTQTNVNTPVETQSFYSTPGSSRRILRIVDRITASNLFQSATEISYVQRAMENMSTKIKLRVELKGLISRITINMPPPPSDRIWISFRGPPRLWITAKPAVGDHTFDWSIVTNVIENKLCDEVYKYLVYPNMVDIIVPFLGQPTYRE